MIWRKENAHRRIEVGSSGGPFVFLGRFGAAWPLHAPKGITFDVMKSLARGPGVLHMKITPVQGHRS
jgi:hypothetical protein